MLECQLQRPLPDDLAEALANGVILCQLANQLRPRCVPFIHVPSPAVVSWRPGLILKEALGWMMLRMLEPVLAEETLA